MTPAVLGLASVLGHLAPARFRARLRYDGAGFHGVQKNRRTDDGTELRTILSTLEQALWPALGQQVKFGMAGRTDAGVSATGQVMTFDALPSRGGEEDGIVELAVCGATTPVPELADALSACLPADVQITEVAVVPRSFDVVRDCRWKRYRYQLPPCAPRPDDEEALRVLKMVRSHAARAARQRAAEADGEGAVRAPRRRRRDKDAAPLAVTEVASMRRAAALLQGTHDFAAFQASRGDQKGTVRTVYRCAVERRTAADGADASTDGYDIVIEGDGFLYKMVRIVAGTLTMVGMGLAPPETVAAALAADEGPGGGAPAGATAGASAGGSAAGGDPPPIKSELRRRGVVGPTLPPERLSLEHVEYEHEHDMAADL